MAREGYNATIHLLNGRVFEVITECTEAKEGLLYFMGDSGNDDEYEDEDDNWNSFLRIPVANIEYIEEEPVRDLRKSENYGVVNITVEKVAKIQSSKPDSGKNRLQEIE